MTEQGAAKLRWWLLPSVTAWLWLLILLVLLSAPWRTASVASDGDPCMHWRCGEWMLQHGRIIRTDEFSHTKFGAPVIAKEWLAQIVFALAGRAGGLFGLCVVAALVIATTFALLHRQLLRVGSDLLTATVLVLLGAWAASVHWLARPHVYSFLLLLLWHGALLRWEQDGRNVRLMLRLAVLAALWVNLHGGYLAGFLLLGAYWVGAALERDRRRLTALTVAGLVTAAASLANPNGWRLHAHNIAFLQSKFLTGWLAEYSSQNFQSAGTRGFLVWLALIFFTLALARPRLSAGRAAALLSWTYFALYAGRNIPFLVIVSAPLLALPVSDWLRRAWPALVTRFSALFAGTAGWPVVGAVAAAVILFVPHPTELSAKDWPVEAVAHIRAHPAMFAGNMFNQYVWGGYLLLALPEHRTFVDARTDFFGEPIIRAFDDVTALRTNWLEVLDRYEVAWTLMPTDHRLNQALQLAGWQMAHSNAVSLIFLRRIDGCASPPSALERRALGDPLPLAKWDRCVASFGHDGAWPSIRRRNARRDQSLDTEHPLAPKTSKYAARGSPASTLSSADKNAFAVCIRGWWRDVLRHVRCGCSEPSPKPSISAKTEFDPTGTLPRQL